MFTFFEYQNFWLLFPIGIMIATTAMATGIDGAVFWAPVLLFGFDLEPELAIACGVFIEVFGFGSGVYAYAMKKRILYSQIKDLLFFAIIFGLLGAVMSKIIPNVFMYALLGASAIFLFFINLDKALHKKNKIHQENHVHQIKYKFLGNTLNAFGGFMTGLIGVGLGEVNNYYFLNKNKLSIPYASGNSVFLIALTAFICSIFNIIYFSETLPFHELRELYTILLFAIPSVVIGARMGVLLAHKINPKIFHYFVAVLFI